MKSARAHAEPPSSTPASPARRREPARSADTSIHAPDASTISITDSE